MLSLFARGMCEEVSDEEVSDEEVSDEEVSDSVQHLTGRPPRTLSDYVAATVSTFAEQHTTSETLPASNTKPSTLDA